MPEPLLTPPRILIIAKVMLVLYGGYRLFSAFGLNIPIGLGCKIAACFLSPLPEMSSYCRAYCPVFENFRDTYLQYDPILSGQDERVTVYMMLYGLFFTPFFVILIICALFEFQQKVMRKVALLMASGFIGLVAAMAIEEIMRSSSPIRVLGYNLVDIIGPFYLLFYFWSAWEAQKTPSKTQNLLSVGVFDESSD